MQILIYVPPLLKSLNVPYCFEDKHLTSLHKSQGSFHLPPTLPSLASSSLSPSLHLQPWPLPSYSGFPQGTNVFGPTQPEILFRPFHPWLAPTVPSASDFDDFLQVAPLALITPHCNPTTALSIQCNLCPFSSIWPLDQASPVCPGGRCSKSPS